MDFDSEDAIFKMQILHPRERRPSSFSERINFEVDNFKELFRLSRVAVEDIVMRVRRYIEPTTLRNQSLVFKIRRVSYKSDIANFASCLTFKHLANGALFSQLRFWDSDIAIFDITKPFPYVSGKRRCNITFMRYPQILIAFQFRGSDGFYRLIGLAYGVSTQTVCTVQGRSQDLFSGGWYCAHAIFILL